MVTTDDLCEELRDGFWIAEEQDRRDEDGDHEWYAFDTWAEAITYADRRARQAGTEVAP